MARFVAPREYPFMRAFLRLLGASSAAPLALALAACSTADAPHTNGPLPDVPNESTPEGLPAFDQDPCAHLRGGSPGLHAASSDLGRAHALVRYFGADPVGAVADGHLADALDAHGPGERDAVVAYASAVTGACSAPATTSGLVPASVTMQGGIAIVVPGSSELPDIPAKTTAIALDLRDLPEGEEARDALERALTRLLGDAGPLLDVEERSCSGQPDEVYKFYGMTIDQYACTVKRTAAAPKRGESPALPLAVLTAPRLTPLAAYAAAALRARVGALVIGESVPAQIAESTWVGVGDHGMAVQTRRLYTSATTMVPDVIESDVRTTDPVAELANVDWLAERPALEGAVTRKKLVDFERPTKWRSRGDRVGDGRAALVAAYAATRTFFPYFDAIDDVIDARLDECLAMLEGKPGDREVTRLAIERFSEAIHDGHSSVSDAYAHQTSFSRVALTPVGDQLVVAISTAPEVRAGDVVTKIDGASASAEMTRALRFVSGSPQAARRTAASRLLSGKTTTLTLERGGATLAVTIQPGTEPLSTLGMFDRPSGTLGDLGAADIYYLSLNSLGAFAPKATELASIQAAMSGKKGVILDMRGYPDLVGWALLGYVASAESTGPKMANLLIGPSSRTVEPQPTQVLGSLLSALRVSVSQGYVGPLVLLTGAYTQSSAEHWTNFFRSKKRGKIVGGKTSGANGTVTGVQLPGGFGLTFTGTIVQQPDGSPFHARGHTPDIEVAPTAADLRDGKDTVLLRAIEELR